MASKYFKKVMLYEERTDKEDPSKIISSNLIERGSDSSRGSGKLYAQFDSFVDRVYEKNHSSLEEVKEKDIVEHAMKQVDDILSCAGWKMDIPITCLRVADNNGREPFISDGIVVEHSENKLTLFLNICQALINAKSVRGVKSSNVTRRPIFVDITDGYGKGVKSLLMREAIQKASCDPFFSGCALEDYNQFFDFNAEKCFLAEIKKLEAFKNMPREELLKEAMRAALNGSAEEYISSSLKERKSFFEITSGEVGIKTS